jgi:hypothetical protein
MADQHDSRPILEAIMKILVIVVAIMVTVPEAEREILKRQALDKTWKYLNRASRWLGTKSMTMELRTGMQTYHLPLLISRLRDYCGVMYEKSKAKIL